MFLLKKILTPLILPPAGLLFIAMLGLLLINRRPRWAKLLCWGSLTLLLVLSLPITAIMLVNAVALDSGLDTVDAGNAQAVVILGGGRLRAPEYGGLTVSGATLQRIRYGARLAKQRNLPILVTGGAVFGGGPSEGELMAQVLQESFATEVQWIERRSRDTHENALYSAPILQAARIDRVLLVTHDLHLRRAMREFTAAGIHVVPAPLSTISCGAISSFAAQLPSANALHASAQALREVIGIMVLAPRTPEAH